MEPTYTEATAVARGVALLDERDPGWRDSVDLSKFSIASGFTCILGQRYGDYVGGAHTLWPDKWSPPSDLARSHLARSHGFLTVYPDEASDEQCDLAEAYLEQAWRQELTK